MNYANLENDFFNEREIYRNVNYKDVNFFDTGQVGGIFSAKVGVKGQKATDIMANIDYHEMMEQQSANYVEYKNTSDVYHMVSTMLYAGHEACMQQRAAEKMKNEDYTEVEDVLKRRGINKNVEIEHAYNKNEIFDSMKNMKYIGNDELLKSATDVNVILNGVEIYQGMNSELDNAKIMYSNRYANKTLVASKEDKTKIEREFKNNFITKNENMSFHDMFATKTVAVSANINGEQKIFVVSTDDIGYGDDSFLKGTALKNSKEDKKNNSVEKSSFNKYDKNTSLTQIMNSFIKKEGKAMEKSQNNLKLFQEALLISGVKTKGWKVKDYDKAIKKGEVNGAKLSEDDITLLKAAREERYRANAKSPENEKKKKDNEAVARTKNRVMGQAFDREILKNVRLVKKGIGVSKKMVKGTLQLSQFTRRIPGNVVGELMLGTGKAGHMLNVARHKVKGVDVSNLSNNNVLVKAGNKVIDRQKNLKEKQIAFRKSESKKRDLLTMGISNSVFLGTKTIGGVAFGVGKGMDAITKKENDGLITRVGRGTMSVGDKAIKHKENTLDRRKKGESGRIGRAYHSTVAGIKSVPRRVGRAVGRTVLRAPGVRTVHRGATRVVNRITRFKDKWTSRIRRVKDMKIFKVTGKISDIFSTLFVKAKKFLYISIGFILGFGTIMIMVSELVTMVEKIEEEIEDFIDDILFFLPEEISDKYDNLGLAIVGETRSTFEKDYQQYFELMCGDLWTADGLEQGKYYMTNTGSNLIKYVGIDRSSDASTDYVACNGLTHGEVTREQFLRMKENYAACFAHTITNPIYYLECWADGEFEDHEGFMNTFWDLYWHKVYTELYRQEIEVDGEETYMINEDLVVDAKCELIFHADASDCEGLGCYHDMYYHSFEEVNAGTSTCDNIIDDVLKYENIAKYTMIDWDDRILESKKEGDTTTLELDWNSTIYKSDYTTPGFEDLGVSTGVLSKDELLAAKEDTTGKVYIDLAATEKTYDISSSTGEGIVEINTKWINNPVVYATERILNEDGTHKYLTYENITDKEGTSYITIPEEEASNPVIPVYAEIDIDPRSFVSNPIYREILNYARVELTDGRTEVDKATLEGYYYNFLYKEDDTEKYLNMLNDGNGNPLISKITIDLRPDSLQGKMIVLVGYKNINYKCTETVKGTARCGGHSGCTGYFDYHVILQQPSLQDIFDVLGVTEETLRNNNIDSYIAFYNSCINEDWNLIFGVSERLCKTFSTTTLKFDGIKDEGEEIYGIDNRITTDSRGKEIRDEKRPHIAFEDISW